jgi:hypothetical protein
MRSAPSLTLDPIPSRIAPLCLALIFVLALLSIWSSALPILLQAVLTVLGAVAGMLGIRGLLRVSPTRAVLQSDNVWLLSMPNGDVQIEVSATLISSSPLGPMVGLSWSDTTNGHVISTILWPDSIPPSTRRQLRIWLRSGRAHNAERSA